MNNVKMDITSNVMGKLEKIRNGSSFSDPLVVITEVMQNSQRAKAKELRIYLEDSILTFRDNGCGCRKPENILTLDYSEWDSTDEGFGIGLWSWLAVPEVESIEIMSYNWKATINAKELFKTGNPEAKLEKLEEKIEGFIVKIQSPYFLHSPYEIEDRVIKDGEIQLFDVYFNDYLIPRIDLHGEVEKCGRFNKYFSTNFFKATLAVAKYDAPSLYYENRLVTKLYSFNGLSGVVEMRKNALTLQEPDRKNYIWDSKAKKFEKRLEEVKKELYLEFIKNASKEELNEYAEIIANFLSVEDYEKLILVDEEKLELSVEERFLTDDLASKISSIDRLNQEINRINSDSQLSVLDSNSSEADAEKIERLLNTDNCNPDIKWIATDEVYNPGEFKAIEGELTDEIIENLEKLVIGGRIYQKVNIEDNVDMFKEDDEEVLTKNILSVKKKKKKTKKTLKQVVKNTTRKVWVKANQVEEYSDLIDKAEYYGVKVFVAKNVLEERVLEHNKVSYITEIKSGIQKRNFIKDICIKTNKERYFLELLQPILEYYNLPANTFKIGHLKMYIETTLDGVVINREIIRNTKDKIKLHGITDGNDIVLDRRAIGLRRFNLSGNGIGIHELKALMANLKTISHELAHLLYNTEDNTKEHFKKEDEIYEEIVNLYLSM